MKGTENNLGTLTDKLFTLRAKRLDLSKEIEKLKHKERLLTEDVISECKRQGLTGARGSIATASLNPQVVPTVEDWAKVENFVRENNYFHLYQRRISNVAYGEFLDKQDGVPGIVPTTLTKLSITRSQK